MEQIETKRGRPRLNLSAEEKEQKYLKNLERARLYQAKRRQDQPDRIKEIEYKYRKEHRDEFNARMRISNALQRAKRKEKKILEECKEVILQA